MPNDIQPNDGRPTTLVDVGTIRDADAFRSYAAQATPLLQAAAGAIMVRQAMTGRRYGMREEGIVFTMRFPSQDGLAAVFASAAQKALLPHAGLCLCYVRPLDRTRGVNSSIAFTPCPVRGPCRVRRSGGPMEMVARATLGVLAAATTVRPVADLRMSTRRSTSRRGMSRWDAVVHAFCGIRPRGLIVLGV